MKILDYSPKDELKNLTKDITHKKTFKKQIPNLLTMSRAFGPLLIVPMALKNNILGATIVCSLVAITDLIDALKGNAGFKTFTTALSVIGGIIVNTIIPAFNAIVTIISTSLQEAWNILVTIISSIVNVIGKDKGFYVAELKKCL